MVTIKHIELYSSANITCYPSSDAPYCLSSLKEGFGLSNLYALLICSHADCKFRKTSLCKLLKLFNLSPTREA